MEPQSALSIDPPRATWPRVLSQNEGTCTQSTVAQSTEAYSQLKDQSHANLYFPIQLPCSPQNSMAHVTRRRDESAAVATRSRSPLHLFQFPAELRNKIFEYAFHEQYIFVRRLGNDKIYFLVQPHDYPASRRYPLPDLLAKTSICRQIYSETAPLPMLLNTFQLHHIDSIGLFVGGLLPGPLHAVRSISLGLQAQIGFWQVQGASGLDLLTGLEHVVVETRFWFPPLPDAERYKTSYMYLLKLYIEHDILIEFT